jgi:IclR family transcriptional regulator, blcABC operon repressor
MSTGSPAEAASPTGPEPAAGVPAVDRAVRLLDHLAESAQPLPLAALARALDLPKSSLHGLLNTLTRLGLTLRDARGEYALGPKALDWAQAFERQSNVLDAFNQAAQAFPALREETIMLAVLDGTDVLYLACRPGSRQLGVNFRVGGRFPACFTSSGKAMLATLPAGRVAQLLPQRLDHGLTRHSVASRAALERQLRQVRERGFAVDDEETAEGMHCFGAAVFGPRPGEAVAAVAVSLIKASTSAAREREVIRAITSLAADVSRRLGATDPH